MGIQEFTLDWDERAQSGCRHFRERILPAVIAAALIVGFSVMPEEAAVYPESDDVRAGVYTLSAGQESLNFGGVEKQVEEIADAGIRLAEAARSLEIPGGKFSERTETAEMFAGRAAAVPQKDLTVLEGLELELAAFSGELRDDYCVGSTENIGKMVVSVAGRKIALGDCEVTGWDVSVPGDRLLTVQTGGKEFELPYTVVEYTARLHGNGGTVPVNETSLTDYALDASLREPVRLGKEFTGWYRDEQCTVPFVRAEAGETLVDLYAGWKDYTGFVCDSSGYITALAPGEMKFPDGVLCLPGDPGCTGVRAGAFSGAEGIVEVYIPANITYIEPGAFSEISTLFYVEVSSDNPVYTGRNGIVYSKETGEVAVYPAGREQKY